MDRSIGKMCAVERRMAEILFENGEAPANPKYSNNADYWKDRASKDLGLPWHKIEVRHFEEWEKRGFRKAKSGEYQNFPKEQSHRMITMMSGASLRK
jgi:hypothetical protein